jgi:hypothetical protein
MPLGGLHLQRTCIACCNSLHACAAPQAVLLGRDMTDSHYHQHALTGKPTLLHAGCCIYLRVELHALRLRVVLVVLSALQQ